MKVGENAGFSHRMQGVVLCRFYLIENQHGYINGKSSFFIGDIYIFKMVVFFLDVPFYQTIHIN